MVLAVAGLVAPAFGNLGVNWFNTTYMALSDTNNPADYPTIPAYGQMYWSTSATPWAPSAGDVSLSDPIGTVFSTSNGNVYLLDKVSTTGFSYGRFGNPVAAVDVYSNANVGGQNINAGYLYAILYSDIDLVGLSTEYHVSQVFNTASYVYNLGLPSTWVLLDQAGGIGPYPGDDYGYILGPGTSFYVRPSGNDASNGLSWVGAKATIQAAINAASAGDTVWVTNGTYTLTAAISLTKNLTLQSVNGAALTTIDANASDGSRRHIITINAAGALVEGFTLKKGYAWSANNPVGAWGAGVVISNGTMRNCTVRNSFMRYANGGTAGGLEVMGNAIVENCRIIGNGTERGGAGGVHNKGGQLRNCLIVSNYCGNIGIEPLHNRVAGGVVQESGSMEFCTIMGNWSVSELAGGLSLSGGSVSNCIVYFNYNPVLQALDHRNSWNTYKTGGTMVYSCTTPAVTGTGNIPADPQFANRLTQDCHLLPGSPCLDTATNVTSLTTDLDGNPRMRDGDRNGTNRPDMGAYEAEHSTGGVFRCNFVASRSENVGTNVVVLRAYLAGPTTNVQGYAWNLDNGVIVSGAGKGTVTNGYGVGSFNVTLYVTNTLGQSATIAKQKCLYTAPRTVYVAPSSGNVFPYATWGQAANNIQRAIEAAVVTDSDASTIVVSNGTYTMANYTPVMMHKGCTVQSLNGRTVTWLTRSGTKSVFFRLLELYHTNAIVDGFSVTNGSFTETGGNWHDYGGGIYMTAGTVRNSLITGCQAPNGGGVYMLGGLLDRCIVRGNKAMAGYQYLCGGGINMQGGTVRNSLIDRNWTTVTNTANAWGRGAGISMGAGTRLENCTVVENSISNTYVGYQYSGAGVYRDATSATVTNCIVYYNRKAGVANNIVNKTAVTFVNVGYSCSPDVINGVNGNVTATPMFVNTNAADYSLQKTSPCVDKGRNMTWSAGTFDLAGRPRQSSLIDIGAYEYQWSPGAVFMFK